MTIPPTPAHRERHDYLGRGDQDELSLGRQRPGCKRHNCQHRRMQHLGRVRTV